MSKMSKTKSPKTLTPALTAVVSLITVGTGCLATLVALVLWEKTLPALYWQACFMLTFIILTSFTRSISLTRVFGFFLLGASLAPLLSLLLSYPFQLALGSQNDIVGDVFVPIIEESIKVLPLLVLVVTPRSRLRNASGLSDFLLIGAALGGGFNLTEDLLRGWDWSRMLTLRAGPHIGPLFLFPTLDQQTGIYGRDIPLLPNVYLGHGAAIALVGLCLGFALLYGRSGIRRLLWLMPLFAWGWVIWDHMFFNLSSQHALQGWQDTLSLVFGLHGNLAPWVLFVLVILAIILDVLVLTAYYRSHPDSAVQLGKLALFKPFNPRRLLFDLWLFLKAIRLRRVLAYAEHLKRSTGALQNRLAGLRKYLEVQPGR